MVQFWNSNCITNPNQPFVNGFHSVPQQQPFLNPQYVQPQNFHGPQFYQRVNQNQAPSQQPILNPQYFQPQNFHNQQYSQHANKKQTPEQPNFQLQYPASAHQAPQNQNTKQTSTVGLIQEPNSLNKLHSLKIAETRHVEIHYRQKAWEEIEKLKCDCQNEVRRSQSRVKNLQLQLNDLQLEHDSVVGSYDMVNILLDRLDMNKDGLIQMLLEKLESGSVDGTSTTEKYLTKNKKKKTSKKRKSTTPTKCIDTDEEVVFYIVENIVKSSETNYLVKWRGFEKTEDMTWEPKDKMMRQVPKLVSDYQERTRNRFRDLSKFEIKLQTHESDQGQ